MKILMMSICAALVIIFFPLIQAKAMPVGTLLYRSSGGNKMYGFNSDDLIVAEKGKLSHIYSGHAAIYVGKENNIDYIVEMQPKGAIKVQAKYFINEAAGEEFIAAKLPAKASPFQIATAVSIAKNLAAKNLAYDFDFKKQKGPGDGEWTCVGLTEKVYESSNISNPTNLSSLEYNKNYYAVDITPDGYDNESFYNSGGDCFSDSLEYSKIAPKRNMLIPAPEILGYDVGLEYDGDRYIFLPYTQALQADLKDVDVDITLSSNFQESHLRGTSPVLGLILKWSLINNPLSAVKNIFRKLESGLAFIKDKAFPQDELVLEKENSDAVDKKVDNTKPVSSSTKTVKTSANTSTAKTSVTKPSSTKASTKKVSVVTKAPELKADIPISTSPASNASKKISSTVSTASSPRTSVGLAVKNPVPIVRAQTTTTPIVIVVTTTPLLIEDRTEAPSPESEEVIPPEEEAEKQIALIAKIYSNTSDDWVEIVNTSDKDLDLAAAGYRLEKAKTGSDPTLVMRIGDENDGVYPGGTVVKARESYLIVNDDSSEEMLAKADAIAIKDAFTWSEDAYTIYLGTASISSDDDTDIIDKLGYGEAQYFETAPAPALKKGYALERRASANSTLESMSGGGGEEFWPRLFDSNDNSSDFILIPFDKALIEEENEADGGDDNTNEEVLENDDIFIPPNGLDSEGLVQLWHFDECYGETAFNELQISGQEPIDFEKSSEWTVGKWGCAATLKYNSSSTQAVLEPLMDINQFSLNFYYRNRDDNVGFALSFYNPTENGRSASLEFTPYYTSINGFPGFSGRLAEAKWPNDNKWHQVSVVVDRDTGYWALYLDAQELYSYEYSGVIPEFKYLAISGTTVNPTDFDELSFWNRSLPLSELKTINTLDQPFNPYSWPARQKEAELIHYWDFNENAGFYAKDILSQDKMSVLADQWNMEGASSSALTIGNKVETSFTKLYADDLSLSFWWRNISSENEGRLELSLKENDNTIMSFRPTPYNSSFGFNSCGGVFVQYPEFYIPNDKEWHHFALTYDSYRYLFKFYVDGVEKYVKECVKLDEGRFVNGLRINPENYPSAIDDIKIWDGVLFPKQVLAEYDAVSH